MGISLLLKIGVCIIYSIEVIWSRVDGASKFYRTMLDSSKMQAIFDGDPSNP